MRSTFLVRRIIPGNLSLLGENKTKKSFLINNGPCAWVLDDTAVRYALLMHGLTFLQRVCPNQRAARICISVRQLSARSMWFGNAVEARAP